MSGCHLESYEQHQIEGGQEFIRAIQADRQTHLPGLPEHLGPAIHEKVA